MNTKAIIAFVVVVVVLIGGYFLFMTKPSTANNPPPPVLENPPPTQPVSEPPPATQGTNYEVIYTDDGFSPKDLTIRVGDTVTWKNQTSAGMWVGSALHPSHTVYSGTPLNEHCPDPKNESFDQCTSSASGTTWSFTFLKEGTWRYHNHVQASDFGSVVVEKP